MNLNVSLNKSVQVWEHVRLQFRFEVFNPLNHPIFGSPAVQFGNSSFGTVGSQLNRPRNIQLGLKLLW